MFIVRRMCVYDKCTSPICNLNLSCSLLFVCAFFYSTSSVEIRSIFFNCLCPVTSKNENINNEFNIIDSTYLIRFDSQGIDLGRKVRAHESLMKTDNSSNNNNKTSGQCIEWYRTHRSLMSF